MVHFSSGGLSFTGNVEALIIFMIRKSTKKVWRLHMRVMICISRLDLLKIVSAIRLDIYIGEIK